MRSLSYILTGRPVNRTDCIDYAKTHEPRRIAIELMSQETVSEAFISRALFATYIWVFPELLVSYEEAYGRVFHHEPAERQRESIDNANRRLARALENLRERTGREIENADARFGPELAYAAKQLRPPG